MKKREGTSEIKELLKEETDLCKRYTLSALMSLYKNYIISCPLTQEDRVFLGTLKKVWGRKTFLRPQIMKVEKKRRKNLLERAEFTKPEEYLFKAFYKGYELNTGKSIKAKGRNYSVEDIVGWMIAHFRIKASTEDLKFWVGRGYNIKTKARNAFRRDERLRARERIPTYRHVVALAERFLKERVMTARSAQLFMEDLVYLEEQERLVLQEAKVYLSPNRIQRLKDSLMETARGDDEDSPDEDYYGEDEYFPLPEETVEEEETPWTRVKAILIGDIESLTPRAAKALEREVEHLFKKDLTIQYKYRERPDLISAFEALAERASRLQ